MTTEDKQALRILRLDMVKEKTGLSRSTIYDGMSKGTFPCSISLGARAVGWIESEINDWVLDCIGNRIHYAGIVENGEVKTVVGKSVSALIN